MTKKLLSILSVASLLLLFSCADEELGPVVTFDTAGKGAYPKLVTETPRELDLANLSAAKYDYTVEFLDIEKGALVTSYDVTVTFVDNNPDNGSDGAGPVAFRSISSSSFTPGPNGLPSTSVSITLQELLTLFNLSTDKLKANDQFRFVGTVTLKNGSTFAAANSSAAVNGSAFKSHFNFTLKATCPLQDSQFTGTYTLSYEGDATGGYSIPFAEGDVEVKTVAGSSTLRQFTAGWAPAIGPYNVGAVQFDFVCDQVVWVNKDLGLGCGAGSITIAPDTKVSPISLNDDSRIVLYILEYKNDGGCGFEPQPKTIVLTKK